MVTTRKFSEFLSKTNIGKNEQTVGLDNSGVNAIYNNPLPFLPPGTTAERPVVSADMAFRLRFNTDDLAYEFYNSSTSSWDTLDDSGGASTVLLLLASHVAGEGASLVGLQDQGIVANQTVQDLANASLIYKVSNGSIANGFALGSLATGMLKNTTSTGDLSILTGSELITAIINDDTMATALSTNISTALAMKNYVDSVTFRFKFLNPVRVGTTADFASTYDNGAVGVGATLTATSNGAISIDGVALSLADRVLVKNQTNTYENGIYAVSTVGDGSNPAVLTRSTDFDEPDEMTAGEIATVLQGTTNAQTAWILTTTVVDVGVDPITFSAFIPNLNDIVTVSGTQTITGAKTFNILILGADADADSNKIVNLLNPTAPQDAATKDYVDSIAGAAGGSTTEIQYNNAGVLDGDSGATTDGAGNHTVESIAFNDNSTGGVVGTATNDNAATGYVGEFVSSLVDSGSPVSLTNATPANVTSISLTAGDWDVWGEVSYAGSATGAALARAVVGPDSATYPNIALNNSRVTITSNTYSFGAVGACQLVTGIARASLSSTTTYYLVAQINFTGGTANAYGKICARRVR